MRQTLVLVPVSSSHTNSDVVYRLRLGKTLESRKF